MKKNIPLFTGILIFCALIYNTSINNLLFKKINTGIQVMMPSPQEGEENERLRERYNELRHKTAPGVSWREIEKLNAANLSETKRNTPGTLSFANGNIIGTWSEKGNDNIAGSLRAVDYNPATNTIFTISNGGSVWSSILGSGSWTLHNQITQFEQRAIKVFTKTAGGQRLLLASGTNVYYSDDNGQTVSNATGIVFPVAWGGNYVAGFYRLNDGSNTIYCLTRPWSNSPWAPRFRLYRSTDQGQSYSQVYQFDTGDDETLSLCIPHNSNNIYVTDIGSLPGTIKFFNVTGTTVNLLNSYAYGSLISRCVLKGTFLTGTHNLFLMINNNTMLSSTNLGAVWSFRSSLPHTAWSKMNVSINDASMVSFGGVDAYRSTNSGNSFTLINGWADYYSNPATKLHADIMEIEYFKKADNTEFAIINCHGGTYVSYDNLATVSNLSLNGHRAVEYYDVLTDTINPNRIFAGSQDQGLQRTLTGLNAGTQNFLQMISGDYGHLSLTNNNNFLWPQYPGGDYYLYKDLGNTNPTYIGNWTVPGTQKPNYGWMLPATATSVRSANEIWVGGGNLTGGGGSYLIKATLPLTPPFTVSATQFSYNFRANSNNASSGITAIEQSLINPSKLFVATEDGTFFYSNDLGLNWNKTGSFSGPTPWYLYGSCILASRINANLIWYGGSGYSNPGVYKSVDGGASFTAMSNGLPATLVNELVASPDERFIFAATEAGPYVYVVSENLWYSLSDNTMPTQFFTGVEYINAQSIVRFSTMGRGIWDFKITGTIPVSLVKWQAVKYASDVLCSWETEQETNSAHFIVERSTDGIHFTSIGKVNAGGMSNSVSKYSFLDQSPFKGINYYRLVSVDKDNKTSNSKIITVKMDVSVSKLNIYPNPVINKLFIEMQSDIRDVVVIKIFDASGKSIRQESRVIEGNSAFTLNLENIASGVYSLQVTGKNTAAVKRFIKQ